MDISSVQLAPLFSTIAQTSFSIAGLFFVAITLNEHLRKRWFDGSNFTFVGLCFLTIVLPGFVSLFGLIPNMALSLIAVFATIFYSVILLIWWKDIRSAVAKSKAERSKWNWLNTISNIPKEVALILLGWFASIFPSQMQESLIGTLLVVSVIFATTSTFLLFRNNLKDVPSNNGQSHPG